MYVLMKQLLDAANRDNYAVMMANCINMEQVVAVVEAAEEEKSAVIIGLSPRQIKAHAYPEMVVAMVKEAASHVKVPVAMIFDHGCEYDDVIRCLKAGYSSIMIDASSFEFEDNIRRTKIIADIVHANGLTVEAELGHVGQAVNGDQTNKDFYTNPSLASEFVKRTGVDCLAVSIGTAHGQYPKDFVPKLDFERLKLLKDTLKIPLVLHGGSGAGSENIKKAVELGINKINVCTDLFNVARDAIRSTLEENPKTDYMVLEHISQEAMKKFVKDYMRLIGSSGRYTFELSETESVE